MTGKAYDLWYDATAVGADLVVLCWISHGPRAVDPAFDPQVGDRLLVGDDEEAPMSPPHPHPFTAFTPTLSASNPVGPSKPSTAQTGSLMNPTLSAHASSVRVVGCSPSAAMVITVVALGDSHGVLHGATAWRTTGRPRRQYQEGQSDELVS